jgi:hypothetical protein
MKDGRNVYTRRDFIRSTIGAATVLGLAGRAGAGPAEPARKSRVVLVRDEAVLDAENRVNESVLKKMLDEAVVRVADGKNAGEAWKSLFKPGDMVGLVPTQALNPTRPEFFNTVQAAIVEAGIPQDRIFNVQQRSPDKVRLCNALVNMPGLKAHWLTGIGTVLKNYIMFSGRPQDFHEAGSAKLGEIWNMDAVRGKTRLILVDALTGLCDKGPQVDPKYKWPYKGLIAGTDPVAVETVCLKIITEKRRLIKGEPWPLSPPPVCVEAADRTYGLGTSKWENISIERIGWMRDALV